MHISRVPSSLVCVRVRLALRCKAMGQSCVERTGCIDVWLILWCAAVGQSCADFSSMCMCVISTMVCPVMDYSYAELYSVCTYAVRPTVCGRGFVELTAYRACGEFGSGMYVQPEGVRPHRVR